VDHGLSVVGRVKPSTRQVVEVLSVEALDSSIKDAAKSATPIDGAGDHTRTRLMAQEQVAGASDHVIAVDLDPKALGPIRI
jgi:hypothetical protein